MRKFIVTLHREADLTDEEVHNLLTDDLDFPATDVEVERAPRETTFDDVEGWIDDLKTELMSEINSIRSDLTSDIERLERTVDQLD